MFFNRTRFSSFGRIKENRSLRSVTPCPISKFFRSVDMVASRFRETRTKEETNFRQIGRRKGSSRTRSGMRRRVSDESPQRKSKRTPPSIPSRYRRPKPSNTKREAKGFGGSSSRFQHRDWRSLPGPGHYHDQDGGLRLSSVSYSQKGFGGFASTTSRFKQDVRDVGGYASPGPASYDAHLVSAKKSFNTIDNSFNCTASRFSPSDMNNAPGPGSYAISDRRTRQRHIPSSSFISNTVRGTNTAHAAQIPSPWKYFQNGPMDKKVADTLPSSTFRSTSARLRSITTDSPGPGQYKTDVTTFRQIKKIDKDKKRPMKLAAAHFSKRKSRSLKIESASSSEIPGPGQYDIVRKMTNSATKSSAWARSNVPKLHPRSVRTSFKAPGPCFYNPNPAVVRSRRNFHRNIGGRWL